MILSNSLFHPRQLAYTTLFACIAAGLCAAATSQDAAEGKVPGAARLALRAKAGDVVKMEGDRKVTTHIHLEAVSLELSTETGVKDQGVYQYRGRGPNGTLQIELHETARVSATNTVGQALKQKVVQRAALCTVKPNMDVVKMVPVPSKVPSKDSAGRAPLTGANQAFSSIRFPERALKPGDSWSGLVPIVQEDDLKGVTLTYHATVIGFEMYQNFPCAHVEVIYTYQGALPAIEAQIRKSLPKGSSVAGGGELTGTETSYFVLDRGWSLNDEVKLNIALHFTITINGRQQEVGGTIDANVHSAVTACPAYDPSLVPAVGSASP